MTYNPIPVPGQILLFWSSDILATFLLGLQTIIIMALTGSWEPSHQIFWIQVFRLRMLSHEAYLVGWKPAILDPGNIRQVSYLCHHQPGNLAHFGNSGFNEKPGSDLAPLLYNDLFRIWQVTITFGVIGFTLVLLRWMQSVYKHYKQSHLTPQPPPTSPNIKSESIWGNKARGGAWRTQEIWWQWCD